MQEYVAPIFHETAFNCPICKAFAAQTWYDDLRAYINGGAGLNLDNFTISRCNHCYKILVWHNGSILYPPSSIAPLPSPDLPEDIIMDFNEAREVLHASPRSSAALLRLALQKLCLCLGQKGKNINEDIGALVQQGLNPMIQMALDTVRVVGNSAVHPGELDLKDDPEIALALFDLINIIVDEMITRPKKVEALYGKLPRKAIEAIDKRDASSVS